MNPDSMANISQYSRAKGYLDGEQIYYKATAWQGLYPLAFNAQAGEIYTFSAYMKASVADFPVAFYSNGGTGGGNIVNKNFVCGTEFARISVTERIITSGTYRPRFEPKQTGGFYISKLMLSKGDEMPFEPYCGGDRARFSAVNCKGGYFSIMPEYGLRIEGVSVSDGSNVRCVRAGTVILCCGDGLSDEPISEIALPCDLLSGDVYYPMNGIVHRSDGTTENYASQSLFMPEGAVYVSQEPIELEANISAVVLVRR